MKKIIPVGIILVVILAGAYVEKSKIHRLLNKMMGTSTTQTAMTPTDTPAMSPDSSPTTDAMMAPSNNIYKTMTDTTKGVYLTDFAGMTLYTFDKDTAGNSTCTGTCSTIWPAYTSGATAEKALPTDVTVITRADGTKQFAWKGMPLYHYSKDAKAGDLMGDGIGGIWHIVAP